MHKISYWSRFWVGLGASFVIVRSMVGLARLRELGAGPARRGVVYGVGSEPILAVRYLSLARGQGEIGSDPKRGPQACRPQRCHAQQC